MGSSVSTWVTLASARLPEVLWLRAVEKYTAGIRMRRPVWKELAVQDWLILGYLAILPLVLLTRAESPQRDASLRSYLILFSVYALVVLSVRSGLLSHRVFAALIYRPAAILSPAISYSLFSEYLPLVNEGTVDASLYAFDLRLFGGEPAIWMQSLVTPQATEWFSFCYLFYFPLVYAYVLSIVLFVRSSPQVAEFALGVLLVVCLGNLTYLLVPGRGPFDALAHLYESPLPKGYWWGHTLTLVSTQGAKLDIFPSLHTALPLILTLYSWRYRGQGLHRFWWVTAFFCFNIMIATMYLRWHYLVDIVAGVLLAIASHWAALRISTWESRWRTREGLTHVYPEWEGASPLSPKRSPQV